MLDNLQDVLTLKSEGQHSGRHYDVAAWWVHAQVACTTLHNMKQQQTERVTQHSALPCQVHTMSSQNEVLANVVCTPSSSKNNPAVWCSKSGRGVPDTDLVTA